MAKLEPASKLNERLLVFSADDRVGESLLEKVLGVEPGVQAIAADVRSRVDPPHVSEDVGRQAHCGVHGHRHGDEAGAAHNAFVDVLDEGVSSAGGEARLCEGG